MASKQSRQGGFGSSRPEGSRPARETWLPIGALALTIALMTTACLAHAPAPVANEVVDIRQSRLPITSRIEYSRAENRILFEAYSALLQRCMQRLGFDMPRDPWVDGPTVDRRYGLADLEQAQEWGYDLPPPPPLPSDDWFASLSEADDKAVTLALFGPDDEQIAVGQGGESMAAGCVGEARGHVIGSLRESIATERMRLDVEAIEKDSFDRSLSDARVQQAIRSWARCMHASGFDSVISPADAPELAAQDLDQARDAAVAQVLCNDQVNLVETWSAVEAEIQGVAFEANEGLIRDFLALRAQAVRNARRIATSQGV